LSCVARILRTLSHNSRSSIEKAAIPSANPSRTIVRLHDYHSNAVANRSTAESQPRRAYHSNAVANRSTAVSQPLRAYRSNAIANQTPPPSASRA
jgi:hypothetical protein